MAENSLAPRVRFAPSPTGYLHVGGARTALFNWLFARHTGGTLILRIEDTDFERSSEEMVGGILEGMTWLGLNWDEGPFFQSKRLDLYQAAAEKIVASGNAYPCFCTKEELEQRRAEATAAGRPPMYDRRCRKLTADEVAAKRASGLTAAIRFAVPEGGSTSFNDAVFGRIEFANSEIEDFVLLRSDGIPTYHSRRRSHLEYSEAGVAISRAWRAAARFCACPADPWGRQDAAVKTTWGDERDLLQRDGYCAGGLSEFSGTAGMDPAGNGERPRDIQFR
jgi:hypothetical protein